ncbi:hypothetical protein [Sphingomonas sp. Leaf25]|uniref:hypothetical protein n=1 Tax=Sphingomonas sp. Leaf25 TaxID=1735692 RepID=UPI0012E0C8C8|nr:hypothetical protein [Sphingomonas sp. Leaf25]
MPLPAGQIERYRQVADYCAKVVASGGLVPSYSQIGAALGIGDRGTVRRYVVEAESKGLLSRSGEVYGGMGSLHRRIRLGTPDEAERKTIRRGGPDDQVAREKPTIRFQPRAYD